MLRRPSCHRPRGQGAAAAAARGPGPIASTAEQCGHRQEHVTSTCSAGSVGSSFLLLHVQVLYLKRPKEEELEPSIEPAQGPQGLTSPNACTWHLF